MKKQILYILFILLTFQGFSQSLVPEFEFQLYFEDAAGNKDTVTLGYDALASGGIDSDFGEVDIVGQPWSESLDVRIGNVVYHGGSPWDGVGGEWCLQPDDSVLFDCTIDTNTHLLKEQILPSVCLSNNNGSSEIRRATIQFYTPSFPVIVRWDKTLFNNTCNGSIFMGNSDHYNWDSGNVVFLSSTDSLVFNDIGDSLKIDNIEIPLPVYYSINKKVAVLQFEFRKTNTLGIQDLIVDNNVVFPNPIKNYEYLHVNLDGNFAITDFAGRTIQTGKIENRKIFISSIKEGLYLLKVQTTSNTHYFTEILIK